MNIAATIFAAAIALISGGTLLTAFLKGRGEYAEMTAALDEKTFKLKPLLCAGLLLDLHLSPSRLLPAPVREMLRRYEIRVTAQITELYCVRDRDFYLAVHRAERWVMALLVTVFLALFALISCSNGEYSSALIFCAACPIALCGMPFLMDRDLENQIEARRESLQLEFPEFANQLILLVNAGSTISKAWAKIVAEEKKDTPLFRELRTCMAEIQAGKSEAAAYEEFARRCKIKEIIKFVSVIILNLRKGGSEVVPTLRAQADECWEARKAAARRLGEKASSKLLLPMSIMLLGIIMIVALPAVLALAGM